MQCNVVNGLKVLIALPLLFFITLEGIQKYVVAILECSPPCKQWNQPATGNSRKKDTNAVESVWAG
jgi:hypothetical protein